MGRRGCWASSGRGGEAENVVPGPCRFGNSKMYVCLRGGESIGEKFEEREEDVEELFWKLWNGTS